MSDIQPDPNRIITLGIHSEHVVNAIPAFILVGLCNEWSFTAKKTTNADSRGGTLDVDSRGVALEVENG